MANSKYINIWIVSVGGSDMDAAYSDIVRGTQSDVCNYLYDLVEQDKIATDDYWTYGTESPEDVDINPDGTLYAYGCYENSHIDYSAKIYDGSIINLVKNDEFQYGMLIEKRHKRHI